MEIIRATADHAATLTRLMHESAAYQGVYSSILDGFEITPEYVEATPTFVAESGRVLGFYALIDEPPELDLLFVADDAQGLGLGAKLIAHMTEQAKARGLTEVRVVSHPPAERFYLRMGARRVGTIPPNPPKIGWERPELRFDLATG